MVSLGFKKLPTLKKQGSLGYSIFTAGVVLFRNSAQPSMRQSLCHMERLRFHLLNFLVSGINFAAKVINPDGPSGLEELYD